VGIQVVDISQINDWLIGYYPNNLVPSEGKIALAIHHFPVGPRPDRPDVTHRHQTMFEVHILLSGRMEIQSGNQGVIVVSAGQLVIYPPGVWHNVIRYLEPSTLITIQAPHTLGDKILC